MLQCIVKQYLVYDTMQENNLNLDSAPSHRNVNENLTELL